MRSQAKPVLTKEIIYEILKKHLLEKPKTSTNNMFLAVSEDLQMKGITGPQNTKVPGGYLEHTIDMHDDDALLINQCIYDLLFDRVITPGSNLDNLELPYVHLNDKDKLNNY